MSTTTASPTRQVPQATSEAPPRSPRTRRTRLALVAAGLIAAPVTVGIASLVSGDAATGTDGSTTRNHAGQPCRLSETAVDNWGETSAHLPQACNVEE